MCVNTRATTTPSGRRTSRTIEQGGRGTTALDRRTEIDQGKSRGKAPPVDPFTGEDPEIRLDDWIPSLTRAARWNEWSPDENLMQLAGHLRGYALQEWDLLQDEDRNDFDRAVAALRTRLDPGNKVLAAQDFRHTTQKDTEPVPDFIRRLERTFRIAYSRDNLSVETRDVLLYGQLQDGLKPDLMHNPAVSGALTYQELCMAARNEERRKAELQKTKHYRRITTEDTLDQKKADTHQKKNDSQKRTDTRFRTSAQKNGGNTSGRSASSHSQTSNSTLSGDTHLCYGCGKPGHLARTAEHLRLKAEDTTTKEDSRPRLKLIGKSFRSQSQPRRNQAVMIH